MAQKFKPKAHHPLTVWRFMYGKTLAELAAILDPPSTPSVISNLEAGHTEPTVAFAQRVCDITGLRLDDFKPSNRVTVSMKRIKGDV